MPAQRKDKQGKQDIAQQSYFEVLPIQISCLFIFTGTNQTAYNKRGGLPQSQPYHINIEEDIIKVYLGGYGCSADGGNNGGRYNLGEGIV